MKKLKKVKNILLFIFVLISTVLFSLALYIKNVYSNAKFEQIIYTVLNAEKTSGDIIINGLKFCIPIVIVIIIFTYLPFLFKIKNNIKLIIKFKKSKKQKNITIFPLFSRYTFVFLISVILFLYSFSSMGIFEYLKNQTNNSKLFEEYYINPNSVKIEFPEQKRNLIYIYLESMESTYSNMKIDNQNVNLIPNLYKIANENIFFSNDNDFGGAYQVNGTEWTMAAIVGQTAGIPLKLTATRNDYSDIEQFLPGVTTLGDILKKEGYNQAFMIGSSAKFASRNTYFVQHGEYYIYDYDWAFETQRVHDWKFWGYEDLKLFDFAKDMLLNLYEEGQPFNFTLLTVDTHAIDGYLDETCELKYSYTYGNSILCSDSKVGKFIDWVKKQKFYDNTTIVIVGDHISMQNNVSNYSNEDNRYIYNAILNSKIVPVNSKERIFNSFDLFPTTLASLGVKIENDRLGLGTNLFSDRKTLSEELGIEELDYELAKKSLFYNSEFLK